MARPSKYSTHVEPKLELIKGWATDGLTDEQIAHNLDIAYSTFKEYKKMFSDLSTALKKGKEVADYEVQNALFKSATGFSYTEEATNAVGDIVTLQKYSKPNTTAQIFWLKNRKATDWRDKTEVKQDVSQTVIFSGEDELE